MSNSNALTNNLAVALAVLLVVGTALAPALGQDIVPRIWDVPFGTHVADLPGMEFVDPACGTNGGPPSRFLGSFAEFGECPADPSGLREIWFIYDDELEYVGLATRNLMLIDQGSATQLAGQPVILSLLFDSGGLVQGYRVFTDPRAEPTLRQNAYVVGRALMSRNGRDGWECEDLPLEEGERRIGLTPIKQRCRKLADGVRMVAETRYYYKAGQAYIDPRENKVSVNQFESSANIEVVASIPAERVTPPWPLPAPPPAAMPGETREQAFIYGRTLDCAGCDLSGLSFKRRDLDGANLSGANLERTSFYRTGLRGADLSAANLAGANLNRADLTLANLHQANLEGAMLYLADAGRANFAETNARGAMLGKARLILADFRGADLDYSDLGEASMNDAVLAGATLNDALLPNTVLFRADLRGAVADRAYLVEAKMRGANLAGSSFRNADLTAADLSAADLSNSDFSGVRLRLANLLDAVQTGTVFTGALMPDNSRHP